MSQDVVAQLAPLRHTGPAVWAVIALHLVILAAGIHVHVIDHHVVAATQRDIV